MLKYALRLYCVLYPRHVLSCYGGHRVFSASKHVTGTHKQQVPGACSHYGVASCMTQAARAILHHGGIQGTPSG